MFFIDSSTQNCRLPGPGPVFAQNLSQMNQGISLFPPNDPQSCAPDGPVAPHHAPLFAVPQRSSVMAAPPPPGVMWAQGGMYGATRMDPCLEDGGAEFILSKDHNGTAMPNMQPMFLPQQQQGAACPFVYMVTAVAVPQPPYTQTTATNAAAIQGQETQCIAPVSPHLFPMEGSNIVSAEPTNSNAMKPSAVANTPDSKQPSDSDNRVDVKIVCRHFIKSCCNRRKCRFLHTMTTPEPVRDGLGSRGIEENEV